VAGETGSESGFEAGVEAWVAGLGKARDAVRQHLVQGQLAVHLSGRPGPPAVLEVGCGQCTQAVALARAGHVVVGLDVSRRLLEQARGLQQAEPAEVRSRDRRPDASTTVDVGPRTG
jgi:S-adenosylmethionine-dependent methyltransferase